MTTIEDRTWLTFVITDDIELQAALGGMQALSLEHQGNRRLHMCSSLSVHHVKWWREAYNERYTLMMRYSSVFQDRCCVIRRHKLTWIPRCAVNLEMH